MIGLGFGVYWENIILFFTGLLYFWLFERGGYGLEIRTERGKPRQLRLHCIGETRFTNICGRLRLDGGGEDEK